jgi:hypothetical protein
MCRALVRRKDPIQKKVLGVPDKTLLAKTELEKLNTFVGGELAFSTRAKFWLPTPHLSPRQGPRKFLPHGRGIKRSATHFNLNIAKLCRVADGKIAEHWDVLQEEVPAAESRNGKALQINR